MANFTRNFTGGKMNKMVDERLVPNGEYIDAFNIRMGSTENAEIGVIENAKGNTKLTTLNYKGTALSSQARCIGAFEDGVNETIYWFVHDGNFQGASSPTGIVDMIVSYNVSSNTLRYLIQSVNDGTGTKTTLNFSEEHLITGIDKVEDLLFFTDDYNQPRRINVTKTYLDPTTTGVPVDGFDGEDILVIKKPPVTSPSVSLVKTGGQENYLEERFISFAYRYRYEDDEYSATSQFSDAAFVPDNFNFTQASYLNEGMTNFFNTADVTFNTGGKSVKGIDLLFKDSASNVVKIIEKIDKANNGYVDNQDVTYTFKNSKIFTILPEADILRLYDNVPRLAKAQTIMGNRLMYGNYVEGYDLIDEDQNPVRLDFTVDQKNEDFDAQEINGTKLQTAYNLDSIALVPDGAAQFDLAGLDLTEGVVLTFIFSFQHYAWTGATPLPTNINEPPIELIVNVQLTRDYSSVFELTQSDEWLSQIGTSLPSGNIQPMITADDGTTATDLYNQLFVGSILNGGNTLLKYQSGITTTEQAIDTVGFTSNSKITWIFPAVQYADALNNPTIVNTEYFQLATASVTYSKSGNGRSLHSNRGYEIGMIYMDEFNRASTALVSQYNTQHIDCDKSDTKNSIQVTIPTTQKAPYWAKSYKFAIKPDKETYDTIFTNIFFKDPLTNDTYFLLEGENSAKITDGQRLIVKADTTGPTSSCVYATVLEKEAKAADFINPVDDDGNPLDAIAGTYMKIKATNFAVQSSANAIVDSGVYNAEAKKNDTYPSLAVPVVLNAGGASAEAYDIPGGSRIEFEFEFERPGSGDGDNKCERRKYNLNKTYVASQDYDNFYLWFVGDNIESTLDSGIEEVGGTGGSIDNEFISAINNASNKPTQEALGTNYYQFCRDDNPNLTGVPQYFAMSGTRACSGASVSKKKRSYIKARIIVYRAESTLIFESEPIDAAPDVWYEGSDSFGIIQGDDKCQIELSVDAVENQPIAFDYTDLDGNPAQVTVANDSSTTVLGVCGSASTNPFTPPNNPSNIDIDYTPLVQGCHLGNVQNQILTGSGQQAAISDSGFFNCYAFGNGCESYKIRDGVLGKELKLGNRVTTTQEIDYQEVRRHSDITYSGVYNDESNVNRLNEFNLGLLNFKALEESFGPIQKLFARETDILTLQEDKISYVLSGKNLLSDAGVGSLLQSVPEVLGTQIARIEEFGISFNPESFAQWGADKYFTDAKRGSVIRLVGTSYSNDQLEVVSSYGMRTWFRDLFLTGFETQKLGGFDPYMNEYVLSSNTRKVPMEEICTSCGIQEQISFQASGYNECFDLGSGLGEVQIRWSIVGAPTGLFNIRVTYDGLTTQQDNVNSDGSITIDKNKISISNVQIELIPTSQNTDINLVLDIPCPEAKTITLVEICATTPIEAGLTTNNEHRFVDGSYVSPLTSTPIVFGTGNSQPIVTRYNTTTGNVGQGSIPSVGSTVTLTFKNFSNDTAVWKNQYSFKWLVSSQLYPNQQSAINNLLSVATVMSTDTSQSPNQFSGTFTMPPINDGEYLYLIYDYRAPVQTQLCYGNLKQKEEACCSCVDTA